MRLGQCHGLLKKYELALKNTHKAIEIGGPQSRFFHTLAGTYRLMGDQAQAIRCYEKALKLDPSNRHILDELANLKSKGGL